MKRIAILAALMLAGCSSTTTVTVPVVRFHEDRQLHEPSPVVTEALSNVLIGPQARLYRLGHGIAPSGTKLRQFEKDIFTAPEAGTFVFVDLAPECDWAHEAIVYFIANRTGAKVVVAHGGQYGLLPGHELISPDGEEFNSLWQELKMKPAPNTPSEGIRR
jgi:hypothetical protein